VAIRKIVPDISFKTQLDDSIQLTNTGFKEGGSKLAMLRRYYYNEESIKKAKAALAVMQKKGSYGSVAFSTIGFEKKFTHHQHCIQSIAIRHHLSGELEYTVFYRAAETVKIFTGDMVFIRDVIMPIFGKGSVCFFFSNATLNSMYVPLMFIHEKDKWLTGLRQIRRVDPNFHKRIGTWCRRYFADEVINYASAARMQAHCKANLDKKFRKQLLGEFE
jgi:hypothetical protein